MIQSQTEKMFAQRSSNLTELKEMIKILIILDYLNDRLNNLVLVFNRPYSYYLDDNMEFNAEKKINLS